MPERICPVCGRSSTEVPFIGSLCRDCFVKRYGVARAPEQVEFTYCRSCLAYKYQGRWSDPYMSLDDSLADYLTSLLTQRSKPVEPLESLTVRSIRIERHEGGLAALVTYEGSYRDITVEEVKVIRVVARPTLCPVCASRRSGEGYRAVVQIRAYPRPLSEDREVRRLVDSIAKSLSDEIVKAESVKGGVDIYLRDVQAARAMVARLRSEAMIRLVETVKGSGPKAKLYVSARIATIRPGDVIEFMGSPHLFLSETPHGLLLVDLRSGSRKFIRPEELWSHGFKPYEGPELHKYMLLSRGGDLVVLVGPEGSLEVPKSQLEAFVENLQEGQEFLVYLGDRRVYLLRRED